MGDQVLIEISQCFRAQLRQSDLIFRVGGEEFHVLLPSTDLAGAITAANMLREAVSECRISTQSPAQSVSVTCSFGVAQMQEAEHHIDSILKRSDGAMYEAKRNGKNQVVAG